MKIVKKSILGIFIALGAIGLTSWGHFNLKEHQLKEAIENTACYDNNLPENPNTAFKEGELLSYRLHYGFIDAGVATLEVKPAVMEISGRKVYHIVGNGYSKGSFDWFFKVRDRYETFIDKDAMVPWMFVRRVEEGGYKFSQDYTFNHYVKKVDVGGGEKYDIPTGVQDMLSAFYAARNLDFSNAKEGQVFEIMTYADKELWPLKMRYVGREVIDTELGKYNCIKFRPLVQRGRVFKKEEDLNVWITDDKNHIPLRAQAKLLIGSVKMDILSAANLANPEAKVK